MWLLGKYSHIKHEDLIIKKAIETAKVAIKEGMSDELVTKLIGFTEAQISIIRKSINN